jgi:hypothetical protein
LARKPRITQAALKKVLRFDAATGEFFSRATGHKVGTVNNCGFVVIKVKGRLYSANRLAWLYCYGEWPGFRLKPLNGNKLDIRIKNLIDGSGSPTKQHSARSGCKGVYLDLGSKKKWRAVVWDRGKGILVGRFASKTAASHAYRNRANELSKMRSASAIAKRELIRSSVPREEAIN